MSYRCGVGPGIPGVEPDEPRITCDKCGLRHGVAMASGMPYAWFLNGQGPPKWKTARNQDDKRTDLCPCCKELP